MAKMFRREFLEKFAGTASLALGCSGTAAAYKSRHHRHAAAGPPTKLDRIAVSSWSLHNYFRATREESFKLPGAMIALARFPGALFSTAIASATLNSVRRSFPRPRPPSCAS